MTDDLVKCLRDSCYLAFDDGTNDYGTAEEAATRIEKLEAALWLIIDRAEHRMSHSVSDDVCAIARKALEGKDD